MIRIVPKLIRNPILFNQRYFSEIQEHKPTPIQQKVQMEGIMAKKQLDHKYKLINSTPNDSIEKIEVNFIMLKEKLNDKHFYMPHKKEYLLMLDQVYDEIMKYHEDYNIAELAKPRVHVTRQQQIIYELQKIRFASKLALFQTYQYASLILILIIICEIIIEEYEQAKNGQKMNVSDNFGLAKIGKQIHRQIIDEFKRYTKLDILDKLKPNIIQKHVQESLEKSKAKYGISAEQKPKIATKN